MAYKLCSFAPPETIVQVQPIPVVVAPQVFQCSICFSDIDNINLFDGGCEHKICKECAVCYIKSQMEVSQIENFPLKCSATNCNCTIVSVSKLVGDEGFTNADEARYENLGVMAAIPAENRVVCPLNNCGCLSIRNPNSNRVICQQ